MLYCPKCQLITSDSSVSCPCCGSKKLRNPEPDDPALLMTVDKNKAQIIEPLFQDNNIIYEKRITDGLGGLNKIYFGKDYITNYNIFVSFGDIEKCTELLYNVGVIDTKDKKDVENNAEEFEEMSPKRRFFWRTFSAVLFIIIVWIVVCLADYAANIIKELLM